MEKLPYQELLTKKHLLIGVLLTLVVFVVMSWLLIPFTFSANPLIALLQAIFTAVPITGVFWLAYHMFMIVLIDQRNQNKRSK